MPKKPLLGKFLGLIKSILCLEWWNFYSFIIQERKIQKKKSVVVRKVQSIHNKSRKVWRTKMFLRDMDIGFLSFQMQSCELWPGAGYDRTPCLLWCWKGGATSLLHSCTRTASCISEITEQILSHESISTAATIRLVLTYWALHWVQTRHHLHALLKPSVWGWHSPLEYNSLHMQSCPHFR